jgi:hypothetical protein
VHLLIAGTHPNKNTGHWRESVASAGVFVSTPSRSVLSWTATHLAGQKIALAFDDDGFYTAFAAVFGATPPSTASTSEQARVVIEVRRRSIEGFGYLRVSRDGHPVVALDYFIGYGRPECPFREIGWSDGWTTLAEEDDDPLFLVKGEHCFIRLDAAASTTDTSLRPNESWIDWWATALSLVFRAAFGLDDDAIMFHAGAVVIDGKGFIFPGPRYAGKSTLSLALAARGHQFFSDEIAWYVPSTGDLVDFRRPVGVREGTRARAVDTLMSSGTVRGVEWLDSTRVLVDDLVPQAPPVRARLDAVVFLRAFEKTTRLVPVRPSREHLPLLMPIPLSMMNQAPARRMLQMTRLLSSVHVFDLYSGHPDEVAKVIEEAARS